VGIVSGIYDTVKWLFSSLNQFQQLAGLATQIVQQIGDVVAGNTTALASSVTGFLNGLIPVGINFLAAQLHLSDLPQSVGQVLEKVRDFPLNAIQVGVAFVANKARALLGLNGNAAYQGLIGKVASFTIGGVTHHLWVVNTSTGPTILRASNPADESDFQNVPSFYRAQAVALWKGQVRPLAVQLYAVEQTNNSNLGEQLEAQMTPLMAQLAAAEEAFAGLYNPTQVAYPTSSSSTSLSLPALEKRQASLNSSGIGYGRNLFVVTYVAGTPPTTLAQLAAAIVALQQGISGIQTRVFVSNGTAQHSEALATQKLGNNVWVLEGYSERGPCTRATPQNELGCFGLLTSSAAFATMGVLEYTWHWGTDQKKIIDPVIAAALGLPPPE
jgi:hypothetical protein